MVAVLSALLAGFATNFRSRLALQLEILALRHQLAIYQRTVKRPRIRPGDRMVWSWLSRRWAMWREAGPSDRGRVVEFPDIRGLDHHYERLAA